MNRQIKPSTSGRAKPAAAPKAEKPNASSKRTTNKGKAETKPTGNVPPGASSEASPQAGSDAVSSTVQVHQVFAVGLVALTGSSHTAMGKEAAMRLREALDEAVLPLAVITDTDAFEITLALMAPETVFPVLKGGHAQRPEPEAKAPSKNSPLRKATR